MVTPVKEATPVVAPVKEAGKATSVIKTVLDSLVKAGIITQAQEDSIQSAITTAQLKDDANKDQTKTDQNGQVNDGTRSHAQEAVIQD